MASPSTDIMSSEKEMNQQRLNALEERAYRSVVDDGLIDLFLGICYLSWGLSLYSLEPFAAATAGGPFDSPAAFLGTILKYPWNTVAVLCLLHWERIRHRFLEPRLGYVQLNKDRLRKIKRGKVAMLMVLILWALVTAVFTHYNGWMLDHGPGFREFLLAVVFASIVSGGGFLLDLKRWHAYSLVAIASAGLVARVDLPAGAGALLGGSVIALTGILLLVRFFRQNPMTLKGAGSV